MLKQIDKNYRFDIEKHIELDDRDRMNLHKLKRFKRFKWFTEAVKLYQGQCFGEQAFESKRMRRNANIVSMSGCEFGILNRNDYMKILYKCEQKKVHNLTNFMLSNPMFSGLT